MLVVNEQPLILIGKEIAWQIKRTTKTKFNQQFNLESIPEDFLIDFIQYESTYFQTNPLRFFNDLKNIQTQLNDQTIQIYPEHYYLINLKNGQHNRYLQYENFSSIYGTKFGSYQICQDNTELLQEQEIMCAVKTISGMFSYCDLNELQKKDAIELTCECNKFGDIFLVTSTKFNQLNSNDHEEISDFNFAFTQKDVLTLRIGTGSLSVIFLAIYIFQLKKDQKDEQDRSDTEQSNLNTQNVQDKNNYMFQGCTKVFKENFKYHQIIIQQIHQIIQLFYYRDKFIKFSYRILEVLSEFNLLLAYAMIECYFLSNSILLICIFVIVNPSLNLIMRMLFKILEAIYRFKRFAAVISQILLILFFMSPNIIIHIFYLLKYISYYFRIKMHSEPYIVTIIFLGNIIISQVLIEPLTIYGRIIIYRLIAFSLKNRDFNPMFHLIHFFVMHDSLEEIFDDFAKI